MPKKFVLMRKASTPSLILRRPRHRLRALGDLDHVEVEPVDKLAFFLRLDACAF